MKLPTTMMLLAIASTCAFVHAGDSSGWVLKKPDTELESVKKFLATFEKKGLKDKPMTLDWKDKNLDVKGGLHRRLNIGTSKSGGVSKSTKSSSKSGVVTSESTKGPFLLKSMGDDADCMECVANDASEVVFLPCDFSDTTQQITLKFASQNNIWFQLRNGDDCLTIDENGCDGTNPKFVPCVDPGDEDFGRALWSKQGPYLWSYFCFVEENDNKAVLEADGCGEVNVEEFSESSSEDFAFVFLEDFVNFGQ